MRSTNNLLFLSDEELRETIEMLFFAYRDFTDVTNDILRQYNFGRAHHRAIYFIGRNPGITVNNLLDILKITKQSLNRVLRTLLEQDIVSQEQSQQDKRMKHLTLTNKGEKLEQELTDMQKKLIAGAYKKAGIENVHGFKYILSMLLQEGVNKDRFSRHEQ